MRSRQPRLAGCRVAGALALPTLIEQSEEIAMCNRSRLFCVSAAALLAAAMSFPAVAQNAPAPQQGQLSLPRPDFHFKGQVGRTYQDSDPATFPQILRPPKGAPNVLLVLLDDVGFGQFSVFGGGVSSPSMESL